MKVRFYFGGFASVGGIETSARNLLQEMIKEGWNTQLVCWGPNSHLIQQMRTSGIVVRRCAWRWGCRIGLPDWVMLPMGLSSVFGSEVILFGKFVQPGILRVLRLFCPSARFVFITPYRPIPPNSEEETRKVRKAYDAFDEIWVQADQFRDDLQRIGSCVPVHVIPYMPEPLPALVDFPKGPMRVGFLGRIVTDKNLPLLLEAFRLVVGRSASLGDGPLKQTLSLEIFGEGPLREDLEHQARLLGIDQLVHFHGVVPQHAVRDAVAACHLFVFTSHIEGQCLAALEILACGRPVVATKVGAFPDILSDPRLGRLVNSSANDVAEKMLQMLKKVDNRSVRADEIQSAFNERFGVVTVRQRYFEVLSDLSLEAASVSEQSVT